MCLRILKSSLLSNLILILKQGTKEIFLLVIAWLFSVLFRLFYFMLFAASPNEHYISQAHCCIYLYGLFTSMEYSNFLTVFHSTDLERIWHYYESLWAFLNRERKIQVIFIWIFTKLKLKNGLHIPSFK